MSRGRWSAKIEELRGELEQQALRRVRNECEAAELAQEVIVRCIDRRPEERSSLLPYARTVMTNLLRRRWRASRMTTPIHELEAGPDDRPGARNGSLSLAVEERGFDSVADEELLLLLRSLTRQLPPEVRRVCEARWFRGHSYRQIAHALGIDETTARVRCHKGRRQLRREPLVIEALGEERGATRASPSGGPGEARAAGEAPTARRSA